MYFKPEMITAIVEGRKTQTRRIVKLNDTAYHFIIPDYETGKTSISSVRSDGRLKLAYGLDYAVCPGRGLPVALWKGDSMEFLLIYDQKSFNISGQEWKFFHVGNGWRPLRIRITAIRRERLQDISEEDARAEGYPFEWPADLTKTYEVMPAPPRVWYAKLWDRINTRKGTRWADSPDVWALSFEVVK